ncbi:TVP38/TMEM64 family protein [Rickettsiales bacterium]|nr:TVP38/TMEM64 family protein [Rickettsiales bacterium]
MNKKLFRIILLILLSFALIAFFALDLQQYATLEYIKQQHDIFSQYYQQNSFLILAIFAMAYIMVTALSLPLATILTLIGGALFGLPLGIVMVSFASSIGATLAFLMARFIARDYIQKNYKKQLGKVNQGFKSEGKFYLFALRLVPIFPFFMVNIIMALMPIKVLAFYLVSQIGMLPGTIIYVYAGTQLAQIESLSDIASPSLLFAFALLGVFPLFTKKLIEFMRKEKNK